MKVKLRDDVTAELFNKLTFDESSSVKDFFEEFKGDELKAERSSNNIKVESNISFWIYNEKDFEILFEEVKDVEFEISYCDLF